MTLTDNRPHSHGAGPTGTPSERFTSRDPAAFEVPRGREEAWRFTPTRALRELFEPFTPTASVTPTVTAPDPATWSVVPMDDPAVGQVLQPADRVSALAWANVARALVV